MFSMSTLTSPCFVRCYIQDALPLPSLQVLPVVPKGSMSAIVDACLKKSRELWHRIRKFSLTENMRVMRLRLHAADPAAAARALGLQAWADWILGVGNGEGGDLLRIPDDLCVSPEAGLPGLITEVFGYLADDASARSDEALGARCILAPKNMDVDAVNDVVMASFPGQERVYLSADSAEAAADGVEDAAALYPPEFLNTLQPQGMPPHKLRLKVGAPIILLRNLNPQDGMANGTRCIIEALREHSIQAKVMTGSDRVRGKSIIIPKVPCTPNKPELPFSMTRVQFPIRPAFAMTINKAQGQTFSKVGVYLPESVFGHGQLYVALSRVGERSGAKVLVCKPKDPPEGAEPGVYKDNVVFKDVFRD